jgi:glycerol-3-phosphate dehydrogenase
MAEHVVDAACEKLGVRRPTRTHEEPLPDSEDGHFYWLGSRVRAREPIPNAEEIICECELITRGRLASAIVRRRPAGLDDLRRRIRLGMGPCQGGFCIYRATGILHELEDLDHAEANAALLDFLQERWKGVQPVLYGDQLRQARLDDWIFQGALAVEHLPV